MPIDAQISAAAEALDADALRALLASDEFRSSWMCGSMILNAADRAARAAVAASMTPRARAALAKVCAELQRHDPWCEIEACVARTLRDAGVRDFRMPPRRDAGWLPSWVLSCPILC